MSDEEKKDILFQIDMELYDEFNYKFCEINNNLGTFYSYKDLYDLEKLEKETEIKLLRQAIKKQQKEIEELKEKNRQGKMRIVQLENEITARIEDVNYYYTPNDKIKAKIEEEDKLFFKTKDVRHANRYKAYKELLEKE